MSKYKKEPMDLVARARAAWNRNGGGIILTGQYTKSNNEGNHYRVLLDGGNTWHGKKLWVMSRASGANYSLKDSAMSTAVSMVLHVPCGIKDDEVHYDTWNSNWVDIAKKNGWTMYQYEHADTIVLIPNEEELSLTSFKEALRSFK